MVTCSKCFKQSPEEAAFCGFCGSALSAPKSSQQPAKTIFGYNFDAAKVLQHQKDQVSASNDMAPSAHVNSSPKGPLPSVPSSSTGLLGGKYWIGQRLKSMPVGDLVEGKDLERQVAFEIIIA